MTCEQPLIRLICELPLVPPEGQEGEQVVVDVAPEDVAAEVARLQAAGWHLITDWPL
jgi:hypothetical protein